jgi:hypothetical protein
MLNNLFAIVRRDWKSSAQTLTQGGLHFVKELTKLSPVKAI